MADFLFVSFSLKEKEVQRVLVLWRLVAVWINGEGATPLVPPKDFDRDFVLLFNLVNVFESDRE